MFRGISPLSLDNKGRLLIPAKYRQRLLEADHGQVVITIDRDRCLLLYPLAVWEDIERQLVQLSSTNQRARSLKRLLLGHAEECCLDAGGRILLPPPLREFAKLDKRVILVGQGNKFEIWNEQSWYDWREALLAHQDDGPSLSDLDSLAF